MEGTPATAAQPSGVFTPNHCMRHFALYVRWTFYPYQYEYPINININILSTSIWISYQYRYEYRISINMRIPIHTLRCHTIPGISCLYPQRRGCQYNVRGWCNMHTSNSKIRGSIDRRHKTGNKEMNCSATLTHGAILMEYFIRTIWETSYPTYHMWSQAKTRKTTEKRECENPSTQCSCTMIKPQPSECSWSRYSPSLYNMGVKQFLRRHSQHSTYRMRGCRQFVGFAILYALFNVPT